MLISRHAKQEYVSREFNDYRWMKELAREKILRELSSMRVPPVFKTEPWIHQLVCFYIAMVEPRFMFLLDMGAGKTKIITDVITQRLRQRKIRRALVGVPRKGNFSSWLEGIARHSDLGAVACTGELDEQREKLLYPARDTELTLLHYPGISNLLSKPGKHKGKGGMVKDDKAIKRVQELYDFVAFDESHFLSNRESLWFSVLRQVVKRAEYCYGATGTLFGKNVEDLWAQFYLIDDGETFGENLGLFRATFFTEKKNPWKAMGTEYVYDKKTDKLLNRMLQHHSIRYDEKELDDLPPMTPRTVYCEFTEEMQSHYDNALEGLINAGGQLRDLDGAWVRMRQIISGYLVWKDAHGEHKLPFRNNPKLDELERLVLEMGDNKCVIGYQYTETGRLITERLKSLGIDFEWYYGGTKDQAASRSRFIKQPSCRAFVMNFDTGGTGTDGLQEVARYLFLYEAPTGPNTRKQTLKRIHRPGQKQRTFVYDIVMAHSMDARIIESAKAGIDLHEAVVSGRRFERSFFRA